MSASTASSAGRLAWMSEIRATRTWRARSGLTAGNEQTRLRRRLGSAHERAHHRAVDLASEDLVLHVGSEEHFTRVVQAVDARGLDVDINKPRGQQQPTIQIGRAHV